VVVVASDEQLETRAAWCGRSFAHRFPWGPRH